MYAQPATGTRLVSGGVDSGTARVSGEAYRLDGSLLAGAAGRSAGPTMQLLSGYVATPRWKVVPYRFVLESGWNMKGTPVASDRTAADLFTDLAGNALKMGDLQAWEDGLYVAIEDSDTVSANTGFWVFSYWGGETQPVTGDPGNAAALEDQLASGWNLYSPSYHMTLKPSGTVLAVWHWNPELRAYTPVLPGQILAPTEGYWIYRAAAE
jgi:hypothetical protein